MKITTANFVLSSPDLRNCPVSPLPEFAFIGRSNVGKSALINMLAGIKGMAKVSGTPGKTRLLNFFLINDRWHLVDLPGYGFAKVSKETRSKLEKMIEGYLLKRDSLKLTFLLVDSRHEPQKVDLEFMSWMIQNELAFVIIFTKTDKLTKNQLNAALLKYKSIVSTSLQFEPEIILTSAESKLGKEEVLVVIENRIQH